MTWGDWEIGKGVHQWYAINDDHVITADSLGNLYLYIIDLENQEGKHDQDH